MAEIETEAPPVGEEVHMPEPSLIPVVNAVGITLAIVGITLSLALTIIGATIFVLSLIAWIRAVSHEMSELPLDHSSH
jgi:hypothetical protein